jgi:hypothetical protein
MKAIVKLGMDKEEIRAFRKVFDILTDIIDEEELTQKVIESIWEKEGIYLTFETFAVAVDILASITTDTYGDEYSEDDLKE